MNIPPELAKAHEKAKIKLLDKRATFFATIVYSLKLEWTYAVPTAGVNLTHLYINPDWYMNESLEKKAGLLAHEAMHVALDHLARCDELGYNHNKYNYAGDYVINNHLDKEGFELPEGGLIDHQYDNMTTEQVYKLIPDPPEDFITDLLENPNGEDDPVTAQETRERLKEILVRAKMAAELDNSIGNVPGEILRRIDQLTNPVLDWRTVLDRFFQDKAKIDYSFFRPNRRFFPDHYLPSLDGVKLGHIVVAIDLSGSITTDDLRAFLSEIHYIHTQLAPEKLTILGWDTRVSDVHEITESDDILDVEFTGGGGTDFHPVMRWINKHEPQGAVIFTDGYYDEWHGEVKSDLIFVIKDNDGYESNIGETVHYRS